MRCFILALALIPATAAAHQGLTVGFDAPLGVQDVVTAGDPYTVAWHDGDLGSFRLQLWARSTPPAPYLHAWPLGSMTGKGEALGGAIEVRDQANAVVVDTAALGPGSWFFWFSVTDDRGITEYQPPAGVLTIVAPGEEAPPAVWFDRPAALFTATLAVVENEYELAYSTRPAEGVTVALRSSVNDLEGKALAPVADGLPGGSSVPFTVSLRCVSGIAGYEAVVRDALGRTGRAFATARLSHRPPAGEELPGDCEPTVPPEESPADGGCQACPGSASGLLGMLALAAFTRRGVRGPRSSPRRGREDRAPGTGAP